MATNQQLAELLLRYSVDQQSLKKTLAANAQLSASVVQIGKSNVALANTAKLVQGELEAVGRTKQLDALALSFARGEINARQLVTALQGLKATQNEIRSTVRESDRLAASLTRAAIAGETGRGRFVSGGRLQGGALGRFGSELRMLPSIQIPGAGVGTDSIANVLRLGGALNNLLQGIGLSLTALTVAGGATLIGLGALVAVYNAFNAELEANKKRAEDFGDALAEAFRAGTTAAIQELQRQKQIELEAAQATKAVLEQRAEDARAQLALTMENLSDSIANTMESASAAIFGTDGRQRQLTSDVSVEAYQEQIKVQQAAIESAEIALEAYNLVMGSSTPATRDAEEAEKRLADARRETLLATADAAASDSKEIAALLRGTTEQALERKRALQEEANALQAAIAVLRQSGDTSDDVAEQLSSYQTELDGVRSDLTTLNALLPQIRIAEAIKGAPEAIKRLVDLTSEFNKETAQIAARRTLSADRDTADFIRSRQQTLADFYSDLARQDAVQLSKQAELRARIAEIDSANNAEAIERTKAFNKDQQRLNEDHQAAIAKINEDAFYGVQDAIAGRNSAAAQAAVRQQKRALAEEDRAYQLEKGRREQDFNDEQASQRKQSDLRRQAAVQALADSTAQYAAERELRVQDFELRIARENEQRQLTQQRLAEDQALENAARQQAFEEKRSAIIRDAGLNGQFLNNLVSTMTNVRDIIIGSMQSAAQAVSSIQIRAPQVQYYNPQTGNPQVTSSGQFGAPTQGVTRGGQYIPRFADGVITGVNRPIMGIVGDNPRYREAVIPLRPNVFRDLGVGGGGGGSTVVNLNVGKDAIRVVANDGQSAREVAAEVVTQFATVYTPKIMKVIEERTG